MKEELQEKLFRKYPKLYGRKDLPMQETCMCWGIECGEGWFDILDRLSHQLSKYDVYAEQVKEKFGGLRFYVSFGVNINEADVDEIYKLIGEAETKSMQTCENCGKPGITRQGGWIRTLCDTCNKKD